MKVFNQSVHRAHTEIAYSKLAMLALCAIGIVATIAKQQLAAAADSSSTTISLVGLDLSTPQGIQVAHDRLHEAARRMCSRVVDPWTLSHQPDYVRCVDETLADAMQKVTGNVRVATARPHDSDRSAQ